MQIRTEIEIQAPVAEVWKALTDFAAYEQWNPFITEISGELRPGARLHVCLQLPEGGQQRFRPVVLRADPEQELRWRGKLLVGALFSGEHFFRLSAGSDANSVRLVHGEDFSGVLVPYLHRSITLATRGFVYMNQALKRHLEQT